jgi:shikimate dehydrogenase
LIEVEALPVSALVMDMIFNPPRTPLLRDAEARGCSVLNGLSMLLYQGTLAFELWTGQSAPEDVMRAALGL